VIGQCAPTLDGRLLGYLELLLKFGTLRSFRGTRHTESQRLTAAGPLPVKAKEAETFLRGKKPEPTVLAEAARLTAAAGSPTADRRGSVEYKREVARVLAARALQKAVQRAEGR